MTSFDKNIDSNEILVKKQAHELEMRLADFGIVAEVSDICDGPSVQIFYIMLAKGERVSKVIALSDDIALVMGVRSCRVFIERGKGMVAIELSKLERRFFDIESVEQNIKTAVKSQTLPIALGMKASGEMVVADLAGMPHLLIAGTTGSGKSIALHAIIVSLITYKELESLRLMIIDPKIVEFSSYGLLPHLLCPIITSVESAISSLRWAVSEMMNRYQKLNEAGVRNINSFNITNCNKMHRIVIIIDELADLMVVSGADVDDSLMRLAQMGRAAGIHLVIATQRPSVDVITGTIKANFPTRISFHLASSVDSRTIIGRKGAECLLGAGDMLFSEQGRDYVRMQAPFVSEGYIFSITSKFESVKHDELMVSQNVIDMDKNTCSITTALQSIVDSGETWSGTATKLCDEINKRDGVFVNAQQIGLFIKRNHRALLNKGIDVRRRHSGQRHILITPARSAR
ncbi:DNA translocase FtsK [Methylosinus sp. Sm6]|uniref:DNA translocase FtsK n=1 Tax=Methylosinus sp. Sm6 TaxID=2866948 RepID=UPI001C99805B|nr:DNA translocase FtsK [Methylosinus sp. Sm6]MBY6239825.1 hypothetical protein [Methylosinus sp. Sm6]